MNCLLCNSQLTSETIYLASERRKCSDCESIFIYFNNKLISHWVFAHCNNALFALYVVYTDTIEVTLRKFEDPRYPSINEYWKTLHVMKLPKSMAKFTQSEFKSKLPTIIILS